MNPKSKNRLRLFLKLGISATLLVFVYQTIDITVFWNVLIKSHPLVLLPAIGLFILSKWTSAIRLNHFLSTTGVKISDASNTKLYILGMYHDLFLPGGKGGDSYKLYFLNKHAGISMKEFTRAARIDRLSGLLALLNLAVFFFCLFNPNNVGFNYFWFVIPLSYVLFYLFIRYYFRTYQNILLRTNMLSLVIQASQLACAVLILNSTGLNDHYPEYLFIFLISSVAATIPVTIGGAGAREITFLGGTILLHLDVNVGVLAGLLFYLITAMVSLGGIYYNNKEMKNISIITD
ncbi:MAG: lysylphosphatidylglycerol synthase transmembrane domain-containing protein [Bacteroidia bacterium]|nr:lysylphosphatidylglycerol synthase transmembrane domain-containing protein [Bacteroidia bacterium]